MLSVSNILLYGSLKKHELKKLILTQENAIRYMTYVKYAPICSYINVNHVISTLGRTGFRFNKDSHCEDKPLS